MACALCTKDCKGVKLARKGRDSGKLAGQVFLAHGIMLPEHAKQYIAIA
jgi:hypothetical protein